ncbi:hypothetical protein TL16_g04759 [Triparma laevis f. inornata]|uniref:Uncharacterized protein n=2 Tax=Triparma laevis TaxID=1534972 RepID=A0A9W7E964_9STRA|nr:hypothetical protein TL16_g04759 [Triparma laevis f. inornata]GMH70517.1 hypothetical protein TrLO_g13842 [Triparma laevis f. longispina]
MLALRSSLLRSSLSSSLPHFITKPFTTKQPEWQRLAEEEAIAATNSKALKQGTMTDTMMSKLTHELQVSLSLLMFELELFASHNDTISNY